MVHLILLLVLILIFGVGIFTISFYHGLYESPEFLGNLLTELHGVFAESVLVVVILGGVTSRIQYFQTKQRLLEELDASRRLRGPEVRNRVIIIIETLLKLGEKDINMANLDLSWGVPTVSKKLFLLNKYRHINITGSHFCQSSFNGATLYGHVPSARNNYTNCDFTECDLSNSNLINCNFSDSLFLVSKFNKARVLGCDFSKAKGLTPKMLLESETLYGSKFHDDLKQKILELKPSLLNDQPLSDEEMAERRREQLKGKGLVPEGVI